MTLGTISQRGHLVIESRAKMKLFVFNVRKNITFETIEEGETVLMVIVSEVRN